MNYLFEKSLKLMRKKIYPLFFKPASLPAIDYEKDPKKIQQMIFSLLQSSQPCMIARFGSTELLAVTNYLGIKNNPHSPLKYIKGEIGEWWWNKNGVRQLRDNAGFFPITEPNIGRFCELMIKDARQVDMLGCWLPEEYHLRHELANATRVKLSCLEPPYLYDDPSIPSWASALRGKKVLVIHPFAETIRRQYEKREHLFKRKDILPDFDLITIKAVQSLGGDSDFKNWFDALAWMENQMDHTNYDICIIGCGAYGFPLAAHAKRTGHHAIHLGGATQLLFGIKGKRWDLRPEFRQMYNEYWVRPSQDEKPKIASRVEDACYW